MMTAPAKILVVDDDPTARLLMRAALQKAGFDVRLAVDGADALRQFAEAPFDLLMLDVDMPGMSGIELCAVLRSQGGEHLPIVMVTGMDDVTSVEATYRSGATDFIAKPINWALIGHRVRYILRASRALSELSEANTRSKLAEADLVRSQNDLVSTLKAIPDLLFELGLDGRYYNTHCAHIELLAAPAHLLMGRLVSEVLPADAAAVCLEALREAHQHEFSQGRQFGLRLGNELKWFELSISRKADIYPEGPRFVVLSRDITERKQAQEEMLCLNATLEERVRQRTTELMRTETALRQSQKLEALGQLTGGVAHDFNNLLAVISSSVELLRSDKLPAERRGHYLQRIFDTVGRAVKLTSQLLSFARQQPLSPEVFDVDQQVRGVVDLVRPLMGSQVRIELAPCGEPGCFAEADINQFETALVNLAVNARDAMNARGELTITVRPVDGVPPGAGRGRRGGEFIAISMADTGCGIAPDKLEAIFEPFYTTKEVGKGTGLGLSQVFGFTKQSGGEVDVTSEPGKGAVFTLYLARAEPGRAAPAPAPAEAPAQGSGARVLVVEDNETLAQMTCEILNALGYRTSWAANAAAALAQLAQLAQDGGGFDVMFSDVVMPGMDGIELGQRVRQRYPGLAVVLTSGYNAVMAERGRHGFELIHKPYASDTLVRVFGKVIAEQAALSREARYPALPDAVP